MTSDIVGRFVQLVLAFLLAVRDFLDPRERSRRG